jgi:hypothetical protein
VDAAGCTRPKRLLVVNWVLSACWDVPVFAVPILGFERGNATTIGLIVGTFTLAVSGVRLLIPLWARRIAIVVLRAAMVGTIVFALYPLAHLPWLMAAARCWADAGFGAADDHETLPAGAGGRYGEATHALDGDKRLDTPCR